MSGGTKNNVLITKPSERFQDTRVILKKLLKFEKRKVGIRAFPDLRSPLLDRISDVVESRTKKVLSLSIIYIGV